MILVLKVILVFTVILVLTVEPRFMDTPLLQFSWSCPKAHTSSLKQNEKDLVFSKMFKNFNFFLSFFVSICNLQGPTEKHHG